MSLVELARFDNRIEAELARLNLEAEGIGAVLFDAEMSSFGWGPMMPIRLMVLDEDLDEGRRAPSPPAGCGGWLGWGPRWRRALRRRSPHPLPLPIKGRGD
jgi:hypothetical protein